MLLFLKTLCFYTAFFFGVFTPSIFSALPGTDLNLMPSTCTTNNDCPTYFYSQCSGGTCIPCNSDSQCTLFDPSATCDGSHCIIPCSVSDQTICQRQRMRCSPDEDRCRQCSDTSDCVDYPSPVFCDTSGAFGICVNCKSSSDCATGMTCNNYKCEQCTTDAQCTGTNSFCLQKFDENVCAQCLDNSNCTDATSPKCSTSYTCSGCTGVSDCAHITGKPVCSSTGACVECTDDSDCSDTTKAACDTGTHTCVACSSASSCSHLTPDTYCYSGTCIDAECTTVGECTDPTKSYCNMDTFFCEICTSGTDECSHLSPTPLCAGSPTGCVECLSNIDCTDEAASVCSSGSCQRCSIASPDCDNFPLKPVCDTSIGCVECTVDTTCINPLKSWCVSDACQLCTDDSQCTHLTATPRCSGTSIGCVECMTNADCTSTTKSHCNPNNICQICSLDSQCIHIPNMNKCWYGECVIYSAVCTPTYTVQITQESSLNDFVIYFDPNLVTQIDILSTIKIQLIDINQADYSYTITKATDTQFLVNFQVMKTIPSTEIEVQVPCPTAPGYVYGNITEEVNTQSIPFGSADLKAAIATLGSVASTATATVSGISGAMIFLGANPALLWGLLGSIQTFYYMLFINVQYPLNVQAFFPIFAMGNLDFIPNPMWIIFPDIDDFSLPVPTKFAEQDVDGLFLANAGNMILLWFGNIGLYGFSYLIMRYTRNMPKVLGMICSKTVETFEWSGIFRVFITSYMDLTIAAFLQLRALTFGSGLFFASSICGIIFGVFGVMLPVFAYKIVQKYDTKPKLIKLKFGTLIEEYRLNDDIHKYFTVISIGRNLILTFSLVYLHNYPYTEIITLATLRFSFAYLLFKYKPYENKVSNISNFVSELIYGLVHIFIFILIHDDYAPSFSEQQRMDLGWGIICGCGLILMATMMAMIVEQISMMRHMIGLLMKVLKKEKKSREKRMIKLSKKIRKVNPQVSDTALDEQSQNVLHPEKYPQRTQITEQSLVHLNQTNDMTSASQRMLNQANHSPKIVLKRPINITSVRKRKIKR